LGFVVAGAGFFGGIVALLSLELVVQASWIGWLILGAGFVAVALVVPAGAAFSSRSHDARPLAASLWVYCPMEAGAVVVLSWLSDGAWINYAIQLVVFVCVLGSRALARAIESAASAGQILPAAVAVLAVPLAALMDIKELASQRRSARADLAAIVGLGRPASEIFFVDRPGFNRLVGRVDLVYDPWLYTVFESTGQALPRQAWLARELAGGSVRVVVATSLRPRIDGITPSLPELGYRGLRRFGPYFVWLRDE